MTTAHYTDEAVRLYHGDCIEVMRQLPDASVDAVVTDPPYGLEFMGKEWDGADGFRRSLNGADTGRDNAFGRTSRTSPEYRADSSFQLWCTEWATEALRVLKPGGHLLAAGSTRTYHRLACAVEDAGFEVRDAILWVHGQGFPKNLNVTAAIESRIAPDARCACAHRSTQTTPDSPADYLSSHGSDGGQLHPAAGSDQGAPPSPADARARTRDDRRADGPASAPANTSPGAANDLPSNGSSARPGSRSPLSPSDESESSGTQTSTSTAPDSEPRRTQRRTPSTSGLAAGSASLVGSRYEYMACADCGKAVVPQGLGTALKPATEIFVVARKPLVGTVAANVERYGTGALNIDGARIAGDVPSVPQPSLRPNGVDSGHALGSGDGRNGEMSSAPGGRWPANVILDESQTEALDRQSGVTSSGNRKAGDYGLMGYMGADVAPMPEVTGDTGGASRFFYTAKADTNERPRVDGVAHPTVKPLDLMRYLVRLVTPPGGVVLEPFAGSGTTLEACIVEGFRCIGIEREADYIPLIMARITKPIEVTLL